MTRPEIVLIGPPFAGKTTIGGLLARELGIPQVSLDDVRWDYYREIGYRDELARELRQKGGFLSLVAYWSQFNAHAIERVLADHTGCVFDLGAGPIVFESDPLRERIRQALAPFDHVVRLLPSPDPDESIRVLRQRGRHLQGTNAQGFDWSAFFVNHDDNRRLATLDVHTDGASPAVTCAAIIARTAARQWLRDQ